MSFHTSLRSGSAYADVILTTAAGNAASTVDLLAGALYPICPIFVGRFNWEQWQKPRRNSFWRVDSSCPGAGLEPRFCPWKAVRTTLCDWNYPGSTTLRTLPGKPTTHVGQHSAPKPIRVQFRAFELSNAGRPLRRPSEFVSSDGMSLVPPFARYADFIASVNVSHR